MRRAFTVIEVIVTFAIVTILIFFAIYSFRYSVANVKKATYYMPKTTIAYTTLDNIISGIYYYVIELHKKEFVDFFNGAPQSMTFITVSSFFQDMPSVGRLVCSDKKITYTESPLYEKHNNYADPLISEVSNTMTLFEAVSSCHIAYILSSGSTVESVKNQIPEGVVIKFKQNDNDYEFVFSIQSNFKHNKVFLKNEKYPF